MIALGEVDGVPLLHAPKSGHTTAGLTFRVGQADETLASRGITHLVEHLAMHDLGLTDYHSNGATGLTLTHFYLEGSETDVVRFVSSVCQGLGRLPLDRLERERDILETEQAGRANAVMPSWRYGAQCYGLPSYAEWGLERLTGEDLQEWARRWFTRQNAVLWVAGERVPPELRVNLPDGRRMPAPEATSALDRTPAWFSAGRGEILMDAVVPRSAAGTAYATVLAKELFAELRQQGGYSYTATATYEPRDGRFATIKAYADAHKDKEDAAVGGFIDVLARLKAGRISEDMVAIGQARARERFTQADFDADRLPSYAGDLLLEAPRHTAAELLAEAEALTVADLHQVAVEAHATALLMVPAGRTADWAGYEAAPVDSRDAVQGQTYPALNEPGVDLVVGPEGVTLRTAGRIATVRFDRCAARLDWPDGRRVLIGLDGMAVTVEPTLFALDATGRATLDSTLNPALVIPRPSRARDEIPQPTAPDPKARKRKPSPVSSGQWAPSAAAAPARARTLPLWQEGLFWILAVVAGLWLLLVVVGTADTIANPEAPDNGWDTTLILWAFWAVPLWPTVALFKKRRRAR